MPPREDAFRATYEALPVIVRHNVSLQEYAFMSDEQKGAMWDELTEPDCAEGPFE